MDDWDHAYKALFEEFKAQEAKIPKTAAEFEEFVTLAVILGRFSIITMVDRLEQSGYSESQAIDACLLACLGELSTRKLHMPSFEHVTNMALDNDELEKFIKEKGYRGVWDLPDPEDEDDDE